MQANYASNNRKCDNVKIIIIRITLDLHDVIVDFVLKKCKTLGFPKDYPFCLKLVSFKKGHVLKKLQNTSINSSSKLEIHMKTI